jgi:hypothetical protein
MGSEWNVTNVYNKVNFVLSFQYSFHTWFLGYCKDVVGIKFIELTTANAIRTLRHVCCYIILDDGSLGWQLQF